METKVHSKTQSCQDVHSNIQVLSHIQLECMLHLRIGAPFTEENSEAHMTQVVSRIMNMIPDPKIHSNMSSNGRIKRLTAEVHSVGEQGKAAVRAMRLEEVRATMPHRSMN